MELGYNYIDPKMSGSYSTLEGELLNEEEFFVRPKEEKEETEENKEE
jgi:predicted component of type VI protein secretion system